MAQFQSYAIPAASYSYRTTFYQALQDGTGFTQGDVIRRQEQVNDATGVVTGVETWFNVDTDAALAAAPVVGTDVSAYDSKRKKLASETLTVSNAAVALAAIPADANLAEVHVWDADIALTIDGATAPSATVGFRQANGQSFTLEGREELENFQAIRLTTTDARIYVEYSREFDYNA